VVASPFHTRPAVSRPYTVQPDAGRLAETDLYVRTDSLASVLEVIRNAISAPIPSCFLQAR